MYRSILISLLIGCSACALPVGSDEELALDESQQALAYGTVVPPEARGTLLSRVVHVVESFYEQGVLKRADCTGTLLTSRWVLTAAHCVEHVARRERDASVRVENTAPVIQERVITHPGYRANPEDKSGPNAELAAFPGDLALLELSVPYSLPLATPLPIYRGELPVGTQVHCYGFGKARYDGVLWDDEPLREAWLPVLASTYSDSDEQNQNAQLSPRVGFAIGRGPGAQGIADGDSGGPCFYESGGTTWLAGVHSTNNFEYEGGPFLNTDETAPGYYIGWIDQYLADEITSLRASYGGNWGWPSDVTTVSSDTGRTPYDTCTGQSGCSYYADWLGEGYTQNGGDLTVTWQCGSWPAIHALNVPAPLGGQAAAISCPAPLPSGIQIVSATYGGNCGAGAGNQTRTLAAHCGGRTSCNYLVHYAIIGDPAFGCAKTYEVQYTCGQRAMPVVTLPAEAGFGSELKLDCALPVRRWSGVRL